MAATHIRHGRTHDGLPNGCGPVLLLHSGRPARQQTARTLQPPSRGLPDHVTPAATPAHVPHCADTALDTNLLQTQLVQLSTRSHAQQGLHICPQHDHPNGLPSWWPPTKRLPLTVVEAHARDRPWRARWCLLPSDAGSVDIWQLIEQPWTHHQ